MKKSIANNRAFLTQEPRYALPQSVADGYRIGQEGLTQ